jgi:hypothetical protein
MTMIAEAAVSRTRTTERLFIIYVLTKQPSVQLLRQQDYKKTITTTTTTTTHNKQNKDKRKKKQSIPIN